MIEAVESIAVGFICFVVAAIIGYALGRRDSHCEDKRSERRHETLRKSFGYGWGAGFSIKEYPEDHVHKRPAPPKGQSFPSR